MTFSLSAAAAAAAAAAAVGLEPPTCWWIECSPRQTLSWAVDKLKPTGRNLGRVFHCRLGRTCIGHAIVHITKQPNLKLKTQPKQHLGSLPLAFELPSWAVFVVMGMPPRPHLETKTQPRFVPLSKFILNMNGLAYGMLESSVVPENPYLYKLV